MSAVIANYVKERRWFRAKARGLVSAAIDEIYGLDLDGERVDFDVVVCTYEDGGSDRYVLPLAIARGAEAEKLEKERPHLVVGSGPNAGEIRYDALGSERLLAALLEIFRSGGRRVPGIRGTLVVRPLAGADTVNASSFAPRPMTKEQTNTSVVFGDAFILKVIRKLDPGRSAELEMGEFLTKHGYASAPAVSGAIEIERPESSEPETVAVLHRFAPSRGDAWTATLEDLAASPAPESYAPKAALLGERVGGMHAVLAGGTEPAFVPGTIDRAAREELAASVVAQARTLAPHLRAGDEAKIAARVKRFVDLGVDPTGMRIHGDLHLGQILATDDDYVIIDFEGEPARPLAERKAKRSPLADVAGMVRSFDYAAATALRAKSADAARAWSRATSDAFVAAYRDATRACAPLAAPDDVFRACLDFYVLEKCLYEIAYEANNRPDWIAIPKDGLSDLLDA